MQLLLQLILIVLMGCSVACVDLQEGPLSGTLFPACRLFELERPPAFRLSLKMWCTLQCVSVYHCYHNKAISEENLCLFCVPYPELIPADSLLQASNRTLNPTDTVIYKLDGYKTRQHEYVLRTSGLNHSEAKTACLNEGLNLLSISSVQEWQEVLIELTPSTLYWMDLTRTNGVWRYGDGSENIPNLWSPIEPDSGALCALISMYFGQRKIGDDPCRYSRKYICEGDVYIIV